MRALVRSAVKCVMAETILLNVSCETGPLPSVCRAIVRPVEFDVTPSGAPEPFCAPGEATETLELAPGEGNVGEETLEKLSSESLAIFGGGGRTIPSRYSPGGKDETRKHKGRL